MKPADFPQQDWRLYFEHCWVRSQKYGVGLLEVAGNRLMLRLPDATSHSVKADEVEAWWPRAGAYNYLTRGRKRACYIERCGHRSMRKSAVDGTYYKVGWAEGPIRSPLTVIARGEPYVQGRQAFEAVKEGKLSSVAINRHTILHGERRRVPIEFDPDHWPTPDEIEKQETETLVHVIYRGQRAGHLSEREGFVMRDPANTPLAKLVSASLLKEGLL